MSAWAFRHANLLGCLCGHGISSMHMYWRDVCTLGSELSPPRYASRLGLALDGASRVGGPAAGSGREHKLHMCLSRCHAMAAHSLHGVLAVSGRATPCDRAAKL